MSLKLGPKFKWKFQENMENEMGLKQMLEIGLRQFVRSINMLFFSRVQEHKEYECYTE